MWAALVAVWRGNEERQRRAEAVAVHGSRSPADVVVDGQVVNASFDGERDAVSETGRRRTDSYWPTETSTCHHE